MTLRPVALTMGDPAGIGGEIAMKAWLGRKRLGLPPFFLIDDPSRLERLAQSLGWTVPLRRIANPSEAPPHFSTALPVLPLELPVAPQPGQPDAANAAAVLHSIEHAVRLTRHGEASSVVTNPIAKQVLYAAGFRHPGHTEFLAELAGPGIRPVMMLACPGLRVVPVTIHLSLARAVAALRGEDIVDLARITAKALVTDFNIARPRLAVAALNPHAGESGAMGREEIEIIGPAVETLRRDGLSVSGPAPADTLFHTAARQTYDAAICMYHDQALIPLKTIDFYGGVNITLGLPFVRTSPDHGTAFAIAGTGTADEASLVAAIREAAAIAARRDGAAA